MQHDMTFYLQRGFDERAARYFAAGRRRAVAVDALPGETLFITFDNGEKRVYDMAPAIREGGVFSFLKDDAAFKRVYIDENHDIAWDRDLNVDSSVVWNNKVDVSADTCYLEGAVAE